MRDRVFETLKTIAVGVWSAAPIELFVASLIVPATIAGSFWILKWLEPAIVILGVVFGILYLMTAFIKLFYLWRVRSDNSGEN
jgi:hypothetical protein